MRCCTSISVAVQLPKLHTFGFIEKNFFVLDHVAKFLAGLIGQIREGMEGNRLPVPYSLNYLLAGLGSIAFHQRYSTGPT